MLKVAPIEVKSSQKEERNSFKGISSLAHERKDPREKSTSPKITTEQKQRPI